MQFCKLGRRCRLEMRLYQMPDVAEDVEENEVVKLLEEEAETELENYIR